MKRVISFLLIAILGAQAGSSAFADEAKLAASPLQLQDVLSGIAASNPETAAARSAWEAARARVTGGSAWPDPVLSYSREKTPAGDKMTHLKAEQDIPFPGKLTGDARMLRHEAMTAEARYRAKALEALAAARMNYYRLFKAERLAGELRRNVEVMRSLLKIAEARYASGRPGRGGSGGGAVMSGGMGGGGGAGAARGDEGGPSGSDLFSLKAELGQMEGMLFEEEQEKLLVRIELNSLLDRAPTAPLGTPQAPPLIDIPATLEQALAAAERWSPMYAGARHEENHARSMLTRARMEFLPDFGFMYDRQKESMSGMTGYEAGLSLMVPLWLKRPVGMLGEAKSHRRETESAARAMRNEALKMTAMEYTETVTHLTMARNYETTVIPAAESAFRLARRQYESGSGGIFRLLQTVRTLIEAQREYYNELYRYGERWGQLERWTGVPLDKVASQSGESSLPADHHNHTINPERGDAR